MSIEAILGWIVGAMAVLSTFVEVSEIKINPWSFVAKHIGRAINREVIEKVNDLEKYVKIVDKKMNERDTIASRVRILRFGDEMQRSIEHSKEHFDQILLDIRTYEQYCKEHPNFENNVTAGTVQYIKEQYMERLRKHDFL